MRTIDHVREVTPPVLNSKDKEMVRLAQRCIMASLDHSRAAVITLTTDTGEHPTVEVPPPCIEIDWPIAGRHERRASCGVDANRARVNKR